MNRRKTLVAPLPWGLGHATRCIPIVQRELEQGAEVVIAASGGPRALLEPRFPNVRFIEIPFMEITYPRDGNMARHFFLRGPQLFYSIWREHRFLRKLQRRERFSRVISDARFGLWTNQAESVFITHQVAILSPRFQGIINALHRWVMRQYDHVWIPDYADAPGLAGILSHPTRIPSNACYIGPLSRFSTTLVKKEPFWDVVAMLSGPEPQRSMFEADLRRQYQAQGQQALMLTGKPEAKQREVNGAVTIVSHLDDDRLLEALAQTRSIVARSGYSTIMDFHVLGLTASWSPTPGQTEQEYLAALHRMDSEKESR